uniref:Uncharacterized protein n=1 Tax=Rhizophora mucronata TaxID=61149 RepID=A0A2P2NRD8_RHIMU
MSRVPINPFKHSQLHYIYFIEIFSKQFDTHNTGDTITV